ncbi:effector-associated constant component EACC1 [Streptomyces sp. NPDC002143]
MRIRIETTAEDDHGTVPDLYRWLRQDADVRRHSVLELVPRKQSVTTMGAVEIIDMVLGQGLTALNLALSYAAWRTARPAAPPITISVGVDGGSITVHDASQDTIRRIVEALASTSADDPADDATGEPGGGTGNTTGNGTGNTTGNGAGSDA